MTERSELLPCPFCGGEAERFDDYDTGSFNFGMSCITCKRCGASSAMHGDRKENLVSSWNERSGGLRCEVQSARCPHDMGFDNEIGPLGCRLVGLEMVCVCEHMHFASAAQAPLDWLAEHKNYELSFCGWDEDQVWELHSVNGGRNDREWTLRATGNTPEEALRKAMAMPSADGGPAA